jgi:hypothetical protein
VGQYYLRVAGQFGLVDGGEIWLRGIWGNMAYGFLGQFNLGDCVAILPRGWWGNMA